MILYILKSRLNPSASAGSQAALFPRDSSLCSNTLNSLATWSWQELQPKATFQWYQTSNEKLPWHFSSMWLSGTQEEQVCVTVNARLHTDPSEQLKTTIKCHSQRSTPTRRMCIYTAAAWETRTLERRRMNREKSRKLYSHVELCRQDLLLFLCPAPVHKSLPMDWRQKDEKEVIANYRRMQRKDHAQSSVFLLYHSIMKSLTIMRHPAEKGVSM